MNNGHIKHFVLDTKVLRLKGKSLVGHITLAESERSDLTSLVTAEF